MQDSNGTRVFVVHLPNHPPVGTLVVKKLWRIAKDLLEATVQFFLHIGETSHYEEDYGKVRH